MAPEALSYGQQLARDQLYEIELLADGSFEIVESPSPVGVNGPLSFEISIDCTGFEKLDDGFPFRARERIKLEIPSVFPLKPPCASFSRKRFVGCPHVQWGHSICLYQAVSVEWAVSDGMFGFIERLNQWLQDAARGQLDPNDAPLHPPVIYPTTDQSLVIDLDAPSIPIGQRFWVGTANLKRRNPLCHDLIGWSEFSKESSKGEKLAAALLLDQQMPMEYPLTVSHLIKVFEKRGVSFKFILSLLLEMSLCQVEGEALFFVLGAPMRRRAAGEPLRQHLIAWMIPAKTVQDFKDLALPAGDTDEPGVDRSLFEWAMTAETRWCSVYDHRPEVTCRRDHNTSANWFRGKSILLLGCGALGSHIAEYLVRAGADRLCLLDNARVNQGLLVRQQYSHHDVGYSKSTALSCYLVRIDPDVDISSRHEDLTDAWPDDLELPDFDLVVDSTAVRQVATALQLRWLAVHDVPPILSCSIDSTANHGIATLRMPKSVLGSHDAIRSVKLTALRDDHLSEIGEAFWPQEQQTATFQPEPGCSEPTFIGSAADVAFFSSLFFNFAAGSMDTTGQHETCAFFASKAALDCGDVGINSQMVTLDASAVHDEVKYGYRTLVSSAAQRSIEAEISATSRTGSPCDETGGILLGEIDDAVQTIYIDAATGAPPDSHKSPERFLCGVEGTEEVCAYRRRTSGGSTRFVGSWHTHPVSCPEPSCADLSAIAQLLRMHGKPPRHVAMLIIGHVDRIPIWQFHLFRRSELGVV